VAGDETLEPRTVWSWELDVALREATFLALAVDRDRREVRASFDVLTLPIAGPAQAHELVVVVFTEVRRIAASLREGWWDEQSAPVTPIRIDRLARVVGELDPTHVHGFFFGPPEKEWEAWSNRLSLDERWSDEPTVGVFGVFKNARRKRKPHDRHLDLRIWFGGFRVERPDGVAIALRDFCDGGIRWWDGLFAGDERTDGLGIYPLRSDEPPAGRGLYPGYVRRS
jgi:hypothetical protein